ncbi:formylmethanofuran dehydrogenase subunit C [Novipirellula artificiosorum]|uniref:Formyltransferase/hydrolase complex Fhc subunit C n=1 Tax=Novipirellula artificiosorum TaxID=2528016 RepID=A0A5C6DZ06_9BACT|nr:formylmethanofuran dehydrogenase subunit C [Novipirellula artificiosorum]TWU41067.1 Formyltransferase/hydrolase complex Fhc subunit C [Novipirellula artificiosorum]
MSGWTLELRCDIHSFVDASPIRLSSFANMSIHQVNKLPLSAADGTYPVGELFKVSKTSHHETLRMFGDLRSFRGIASEHSRGTFFVDGNVGDYAGSRFCAGDVWISGSAGDYLAAPLGADRSGMSGGRLVVGGSVGHHAGRRMRRGEIVIEGSAGDFLGAHLVAGTIVVGGQVGGQLGYAMRRGTLIVPVLPTVEKQRFSAAIEYESAFFSLLYQQRRLHPGGGHGPSEGFVACTRTRELLRRIAVDGFQSVRGDFSVGGQGELIVPIDRSQQAND